MLGKCMLSVAAATLLVSPTAPGRQSVAEGPGYAEAAGLVVYLGVLPAAMLLERAKEGPEQAMHGGVPHGQHAYHVLAAVFDANTGERVQDAIVEATVAPRDLASVTRRLEPMLIAGTVTYGNYFTMGGDDPYEITFVVTTKEAAEPVVVKFSYEHGAR